MKKNHDTSTMAALQRRQGRQTGGHRPLATLLVVIAGAGVGGCAGEASEPSTLIVEPRILAIRADPPVVAVQDSATLSSLLVGSDGEPVRNASLSWRACSPWQPISNPTAECSSDRSLPLFVAEDGSAEVTVADVLMAFPPPPWYELPPMPSEPDNGPDNGDDGEPADECAREYEYIELPVVLEAQLDDLRLVGVKRLRVSWEPAGRTNPEPASLLLDDNTYSPESDITLAPGASYRLATSMATDSLDTICATDGQTMLESTRVYFYTSAGSLTDTSIDIEYDVEGTERGETTEFTAPNDGMARLWMVAIDGDGGTGWASFTLRI